MSIAQLTIIEKPGVGVVLDAKGDYEPGQGGLSEELLMKAVKMIQTALDEREDMNEPIIVKGHEETIRQVYGDEVAAKYAPSEPTPIEPGTILRFPSS